MSVQRCIDPRELTLVSFGGAGGLHVCALAEALDMCQALVPVHAGVLSALGMLVAPRSRQLSRTFMGLLASLPVREIEAIYGELEAAGREELLAEGVAADSLTVRRSADLRYRGQSYTLNLEWTDPDRIVAAFHRRHARRYGHDLDLPVELVNLRVSLQSPAPPLALAEVSARLPGGIVERVAVHGEPEPVPVHARSQLAAGQSLRGPALITETVSTTYLAAGWRLEVDRAGNLLLSRRPEESRPAI
jgi:N-methylhydantoinase A